MGHKGLVRAMGRRPCQRIVYMLCFREKEERERERERGIFALDLVLTLALALRHFLADPTSEEAPCPPTTTPYLIQPSSKHKQRLYPQHNNRYQRTPSYGF